MIRFVQVSPCKHCKKPIDNAQTRSRRYCSALCRHGYWYERHRTPGPTESDYPKLFALLEREQKRHEGRVVGYSILWLGAIASDCEFPEQGRVTRRDGIDGSIQFSDLPYFLVSQLPRVPLAATFYRVFVWVQNGETIERVRSEWCEIQRGIRSVYFYDHKLCYYDPTGRYGTKTLQTWPRGQRRPLTPGAKKRKRRRRGSNPATPPSFVGDGSGAVFSSSAESVPIPKVQNQADAVALLMSALTTQLDPIRKALGETREQLHELTQRVDQADARRNRPALSSEGSKPDHVFLSRMEKVEENYRRLEADLRTEREARAKENAAARKEMEQAAAEKARAEKLLAEKTSELAQVRHALEQLRQKRDAQRTKPAAQQQVANVAPKLVPKDARSETESASVVHAVKAGEVQSQSAEASESALSTVSGTEPESESLEESHAMAATQPPTPSPSGSIPSNPHAKDAPLPYLEFNMEVLRQQPFVPPKPAGQPRKNKKKRR